MPHISHDQLNQNLDEASKIVCVGSYYRHYKYPNRRYKVIQLAIQEANEKVCVIYHDSLHPDSPPFIRDLDSWLENVMWEGMLVSRFTLINDL